MHLMTLMLLVAATRLAPTQIVDPYAAGQLIIELAQDCRAAVNPAVNGEVASFGIPELDRLNAEWHVTRIEKLIRDPHPNELARKHGLDLLYMVTADPSTDVLAMMAAYGASDRLADACPNIRFKADEVPNDPRYSTEWHLPKIQAPGAWDVSHGDSNVIFCVVDQGVDYTHEDVAANVWINGPEDINHNHRFDPTPSSQGGDLDGIDNDGQGYIDDVCGYDFYSNDPDPMPTGSDDHGQHCFGDAGAVTNNGVGVAAIGWGCHGICTRTGTSGGIYMGPAISAIYYATVMGAWVSSHSYGSASPYPQEQSAMQYEWDNGGMVICAAGNDALQSPHYPGAYDVVIGVAASDASDHRASWSNYGTWVDVTAPGTGIISTVLHNGYAAFDGTSMATPIVAGLCALMKAANPGMSNEECREGLQATCDTMPDPDYRAGLMGAGRINATKAIAMSQRCWLTTTATHLNDPNANGVPEPGELCGFTVTLSNQGGWQTATNVSATLTCSDPDITITKSTATFPNIPGGSSGNCAADSFLFTVSSSAVPHRTKFVIAKTATPASIAPADTLTILVGTPRILLVNDYAGSAIDRWYREACDSNAVLYNMYSTEASGSPSADTLGHYPVVVWYTGLDSTRCVNAACRSALSTYLDNGGKLLISGQNIGQSIGSDPFYTNYLKAQFIDPSTTKIFSLGLPGDPIGNNDTIVFGGAGGANNARSCDGIRPTGGALGGIIYRDYSDTTVYAMIHYRDGYRLVYFAAPFEAIDHATSRYVQKWTIMRRVLIFFDERLPGAIAEELNSPGVLPLTFSVRPNPITDAARFEYSVSRNTGVGFQVYDTRGRLVRAIAAGTMVPGMHQTTWDLKDNSGFRVAEGVYFCKLVAGTDSRTAKVLVTK